MANSDGAAKYVVLRGGLTLPVEPILLALELEERGFTLTRMDDNVLSVQPHQRLTPDDRGRIRQWKHHLLAVVDYVAPEIVQ